MVEGEAARPLPFPLDVVAGEVGHLSHARAEAGGADERAVGARQAAARHLVPAGVFEVAKQQVADALGVEAARRGLARLSLAGVHPRGQLLRHGLRGSDLGGRATALNRLRVSGGQDRTPLLRSHLAGESTRLVATSVLGESEVEGMAHRRARAHRVAEAGGHRAAAVHRHDEKLLPPGCVGGIDMLAPHEHTVLNPERLEVAGPHANHGQGRLVVSQILLRPRATRPRESGDRFPGRKQKVLERVGAHHVIKGAGLRVEPQPIVAAVLLVEPAGREVMGRSQVAEHHRPVGHLRPHNAVARSD